MKKEYHSGQTDPLLKMLIENGIVPKNTARVIIDIDVRDVTKVYMQSYLDYANLPINEQNKNLVDYVRKLKQGTPLVEGDQ